MLTDELKKRLTIKGRNYNGKANEIICYKDDKLPFCELVRSGLQRKQPKVKIEHKIKLIENSKQDQKTVVKEAVKVLNKQKCVQLELRTGFGKTVIGIFLSALLERKTIILVERANITMGWEKTFKDYLISPYQIINSKTNNITADLCLCSIQTIDRNPHLINLFNDFGTVIVDENITFCTQNRINLLLEFKQMYMIGLCADTMREDGLHKVLYTMFGPRKNFIVRKNKISFNIIGLYTKFQPPIKKMFNGQVDFNKIVDFLSDNDERDKTIIDLIKLFYCYKTIVFCKRTDHVMKIYNACRTLGLNADYLTGKKTSAEDCQVLISTFSKSGRGFDDKQVYKNHDGRRIQLAIYTCSVKQPEQSIGRTFRNDHPMGIYLIDDNSIIRNHWKICKKWFISHNGSVVEEYF